DRRERWTEQASQVQAFYQREGWSEERGSYVRAPDLQELDASLLVLSLFGCEEASSPRVLGTVDAVMRELGTGPFVYRYRGEDGVEGGEGAFLACSFWLVSALARGGRLDEATELMNELVACANDVGLYSEEIDPQTRDFLGNMPQALTHLALVNAATAIGDAESAA